MLGAGQQGISAQIPWASVGPGWTADLALVAPRASTATLYVVDPRGGRYYVTSGLPSTDFVTDWSGDKQRILLANGGTPEPTATVVDVATGRTLDQFQAGDTDVTFSLPRGLAIIDAGPGRLLRLALNGATELAFPKKFSKVGTYTGGGLETPDGTQIAAGASRGLALLSNNGAVLGQLPVPGASDCTPIRWWQFDVALASCNVAGMAEFWVVPTSAAAGSPNPSRLGDEDDLAADVWELADASVYGEAIGCAGLPSVISLPYGGSPRTVHIPGIPSGSSTGIVGTDSFDLIVLSSPGCTGASKGTGSLVLFDTVSGSSRTLLGGSYGGGYVSSSVEFGQPFTYSVL
jgi:TolB protein